MTPPEEVWRSPSHEAKQGDLVVVRARHLWRSKLFEIGRVDAVLRESKDTRLILHWHGNHVLSMGTYKPGYVDEKDNTLVFGTQKNLRRFGPWTSSTTKTEVKMDDVLVVEPRLTKTGKVSSQLQLLLESCPRISWS